MIDKYLHNVLLFFTLLVLISCTSPAVRFTQQAEKYHFEQKIIMGPIFKHMTYTKPSANNDTLHIYLDGDGSPWINHRWISSNPTPRNHQMLRLMRLEKNTSIYIGRPCYFELNNSTACNNTLWTSHRYAPIIINSMIATIKNRIKHYQAKQIILIGYSGGGALAVLIAQQLPKITGILTIAANLDINAWTEYHGYSPLSGSLNPIEQIPLPKNIFQLHLAGGKDDNIMAEYINSYVQKQHLAQIRIFEDYNHHCCWEEIWPSILSNIKSYVRQ